MDKLRPESGLDYGDMPEAKRDRLLAIGRSSRFRRDSLLPELVAWGKELDEARNILHEHKQVGWAEYCDREAGISKMHAHNMIAVHRTFGKIVNTVYDSVTPATANAVVRNPQAREAIKKMQIGGEDITDTVAREVLAQHTPTPKATPLADVLPEAGQQSEERSSDQEVQNSPLRCTANRYSTFHIAISPLDTVYMCT